MKTTQFKPIMLNPADRWRSSPFDLKFDAKWTHQAGSTVSMDEYEDVIVRVDDREVSALSGLRFSTGEAWIKESAGQNSRLYLETKTSRVSPLPFKFIYLPQDCPHSGFYNGFANTSASTVYFDFEIPAESAAKTHLIVVEPLEDNIDLIITRAEMEILSK